MSWRRRQADRNAYRPSAYLVSRYSTTSRSWFRGRHALLLALLMILAGAWMVLAP